MIPSRSFITRLRSSRGRVGVLSPVLAAVLSAALASCGSSGNGVAAKPASEILAASTAAAESASSVHILSTTKANGATITTNLQLASNDGRSALSLPGFSYEVMRIGGTVYVRGNKAFNGHLGQRLGGAEGATIAKLPAGTWMKAPATSRLGTGLTALTNMRSELQSILRGDTLAKGPETTVNGQHAITLHEAKKFYTRSLYIATTGKPYPIQIMRQPLTNVKALSQSAITTFSGWNAPIALSAPANTVDISQLEGKGH
jgi:hypothetical protein